MFTLRNRIEDLNQTANHRPDLPNMLVIEVATDVMTRPDSKSRPDLQSTLPPRFAEVVPTKRAPLAQGSRDPDSEPVRAVAVTHGERPAAAVGHGECRGVQS